MRQKRTLQDGYIISSTTPTKGLPYLGIQHENKLG